jgi:hypothetical protein
MFHLRHREMTPTLQDALVLLGLLIDGWAIISTSVRKWIALYERSFGLTPPLSELKRVAYVLNGLRRYL